MSVCDLECCLAENTDCNMEVHACVMEFLANFDITPSPMPMGM